ncbi:MAG: hypothetical protein ACE14L_08755 [Terriglobales bacterium]
MDLVSFAEIRDQLAAVDSQAGEVAKRAQELESQRAALETRKNAAGSDFDRRRAEVQQKKAPVDAALRAAHQKARTLESAIQQSAVRQSNVVAALAAVDHQLTLLTASATPQDAGKLASAQAQRQQLVAERSRLTAELESTQAELPAAKAECDRLAADNKQYQAQLDALDAERQSVLSPMLAELQRFAGELNELRQQANRLAGARTQSLQKLGEALYASGTTHPELAREMGEIAATDAALHGTQAALQASLAVSRALPSGTMLKFWSVVVLLPLLIIGLGVGGYVAWQWWQTKRDPTAGFSFTGSSPSLASSEISVVAPAAPMPCETAEDPADCYLERAWLVEELLGDLYTLEAARDVRTLPAALEALATGEPDVQLVALNILGQFASQPEVGAKAFPYLLADDVRLQKRAAEVLGRTRGEDFRRIARQYQQGHEGPNAAPAVPPSWRDPGAHGLAAYPNANRFPPADSARSIAFMSDDAVDRVMQYYTEKAGLPPTSFKCQMPAPRDRDSALLVPVPGGSAWWDAARCLVIEQRDSNPVRAVVAYREPVIKKTVVVLGWSPRVYPGLPDLRQLRMR